MGDADSVVVAGVGAAGVGAAVTAAEAAAVIGAPVGNIGAPAGEIGAPQAVDDSTGAVEEGASEGLEMVAVAAGAWWCLHGRAPMSSRAPERILCGGLSSEPDREIWTAGCGGA